MTHHHPPPLGPGWRRPERETSGAFLRRAAGRYLLTLRPADKPTYPGCWDTPGGHVEPGEHPDQTLLRELAEELGIEVRRYYLIATLDDLEARSGLRYRHHVYLVTEWRGEIDQVLESDEERWLDSAEMERLTEINPLTLAAARTLALYEGRLR